MSPTAIEIEQSVLLRPLREGDVLVEYDEGAYGPVVKLLYEFLRSGTRKSGVRGFGREERYVILRPLTFVGPELRQVDVSANEDRWTAVVRVEDRTDRRANGGR